MEIIIYSFLIIVAFFVIFFLIENPYKFGSIIVFLMLYQLNIETPLPLDARGLLLLLFLIRIYFFDKENFNLINSFLVTNKFFITILIFTLLILVQPLSNSESIIPNLKDIFLVFVSLVVGFILVKNQDGRQAIVYGIFLAGIFSSIDLMFTFFTTGTLNIIKVPDLILGKQTILNHNYPGFLASMGLVYIYLSWYQTKTNKILLASMGLFLSMGVVISTSRSALIAIIATILIMSFIEEDLKHNIKKIIPAGASLVVILVSFFFVYNIFLNNSSSNSFIHTIYFRLYEEPLQMLGSKESNYNKWTGQKIKGSMKFRSERWQDDFDKFTRLSLDEKITGLGPKGYYKISGKIYRESGDVRMVLAPHNGYLIILLERGILGLIFFLIIVISLSVSAIKISKENKLFLPFIYLLFMIIVYSFAQNSELTSPYTYLTFGCIIGNIVHSKIKSYEKENIRELDEVQTSALT